MINYKKVVYVAHPYSGTEYNKNRVEKIVSKLVKDFPEYLFVNGITSFGFLYDKTEYEYGLNMTLWLLGCCDEAWFFGDWSRSKGCVEEERFCKENGIKCRYFSKRSDDMYKPIDVAKHWELSSNLWKALTYIYNSSKTDGEDKYKNLENAVSYIKKDMEKEGE